MTRRSLLALFALSPFGKWLKLAPPTPIMITPYTGDIALMSDTETGLAIRYVKQWDIMPRHDFGPTLRECRAYSDRIANQIADDVGLSVEDRAAIGISTAINSR